MNLLKKTPCALIDLAESNGPITDIPVMNEDAWNLRQRF